MDIQLFATDEELREFPESISSTASKSDSKPVLDKTPNPKGTNLTASELPRSHTDLPKISSGLPDRKSKCRRNHRYRSRPKNCIVGRQATQANDPSLSSGNCIVSHQAMQANDPLYTIREKQWVIDHMTHAAYLDWLVDHQASPQLAQLTQPTVSPPSIPILPVIGQLTQPVASPPAASPAVAQPSDSVPPLLSLQLQPDLNTLARTLSPQALRYIQLGIQIGKTY